MTQPPLNPDALEAAARALLAVQQPEVSADYAWNVQFDEGREELRKEAAAAVSVYLAAALPEVTSVEELDQLPVESVVMDKYGYVYLLDNDDDEFKWSRNGLDAHFPSWGIVLPARVLYRPSEQP